MTTPAIERSFVPLAAGRVHVAACGAGRPILLLHQTPRSWDEYREVLPLLASKYRAIAMDTLGFGDSDPLPSSGTAEFKPSASTPGLPCNRSSSARWNWIQASGVG